MLSTRTLSTGELTLSYVEGPDSGTPLLFLHGVTGWWRDFEPMMRVLEDEWHVYACDLRGHGESGHAPEPHAYLLKDHLRDISALIHDQLPNNAPIVLAGYSMGGMVALGIAPELAGRIRGVVLLEPALLMRTARLRKHPIGSLLNLAHQVLSTDPSFDTVLETCRMVNAEMDEASLMALATQLCKLDPAVTDLDLYDRFTEGIELEECLEAVKCPVLLLRGDEARGSVVSDEDIAWAQAHMPQTRVVTVPGTGHGIHVEQPEAVTTNIEDFLGAVQGRFT